jgi:hypothetical protein
MQHLEDSGTPVLYIRRAVLNLLNAELNPICHLLALLGSHPILQVSRIRVKCINTFVQSGAIARGHMYGEVMVSETNIRPRNHDKLHLTL